MAKETTQQEYSDLPSSYNSAEVEGPIYQQWLDSGFFNPDNLPEAESRPPFTIVMPPPNANAPLHVGHALGLTIEDIIIRYHRMAGKRALFLPGTDHAGFETQVVFEKKLEKAGRSRFKMEREEFYQEVWDFVQENKHISEEGIKRLGVSCDWSRNTFTLDPKIVEIVYETFSAMYRDGLVYKGDRIGNWCSKHQTTLSDLETKYEERQEPLYYLKYGPFTITTARPETKFGDKYVVMHPEDKRYAEFSHGQTVELEWINGPVTATIIKDPVIDMEFGTGVMTITPWHDATDFEIASRHNLDKQQIIDTYGKLLPVAGEFAGQKILIARPLIVQKLQEKGLVEKVDETYKHNVQICYKCGTVIEPQIIPQWYVNMTKPVKDNLSLRDMAVQAVNIGTTIDNEIKKDKDIDSGINIIPERFKGVFLHWMNNIRDWPISRQIAWGIRIPVWYKDEEIHVGKLAPEGEGWVQDSDTFDTWFSSGQWPYATLMANREKDFQDYYPTQVLETGWDIIFFWVARMVIFGYYKTGKRPFQTVLLHGLVRDKDRQKMSKSKGNVVDPLGVIDTYGTDALRFALIFSTAAGSDIPLSEDKIKGMKHFANKLWNIARFVITNIDRKDADVERLWGRPEPITEADKDILPKLDSAIVDVTTHLESYRLHEAAQAIYQFTWHELADVYLEASKSQLANEKTRVSTEKMLFHCLSTTLELLHPFMPFITEHIANIMTERGLRQHPEPLLISSWPK